MGAEEAKSLTTRSVLPAYQTTTGTDAGTFINYYYLV